MVLCGEVWGRAADQPEGAVPQRLVRRSPLVGQELAVQGDLHARSFLGVDALHVRAEGDGAHDAVAEVLVDEFLQGGSVHLHGRSEERRVGTEGIARVTRSDANVWMCR